MKRINLLIRYFVVFFLVYTLAEYTIPARHEVYAAQIGSLEISNVPDTLNPNLLSNVIFTIRVNNPNSSDASLVVVNALLPTGLTYVTEIGRAHV